MPGLPFNLDDLIHTRATETNRVEFKAAWDERIKLAVTHTICALANDLLNLNGGYIVLGIRTDQDGQAALPPAGLDHLNMEKIQKENLITHKFQPQLTGDRATEESAQRHERVEEPDQRVGSGG